jgi:hypothetical protein
LRSRKYFAICENKRRWRFRVSGLSSFVGALFLALSFFIFVVKVLVSEICLLS